MWSINIKLEASKKYPQNASIANKERKDKADGVIVLQWREGQVTLPFECKKGFKRHSNQVLLTALLLIVIFEYLGKSQMAQFQGYRIHLPKTCELEVSL